MLFDLGPEYENLGNFMDLGNPLGTDELKERSRKIF